MPLAGLDQDTLKGGEIPVVAEHLEPPGRAVHDVVDVSGGSVACLSSHGKSIVPSPRQSNKCGNTIYVPVSRPPRITSPFLQSMAYDPFLLLQVFLAAPESSYLNGAVIPVDGGWLAGYSRDF